MARIKVVAIGSAVLLVLVAAVTLSAISHTRRGPTPYAENEPGMAGWPSDSGRTGASSRSGASSHGNGSARSAASSNGDDSTHSATSEIPGDSSNADSPARAGDPVRAASADEPAVSPPSRWTVVSVPVDRGTLPRYPSAGRASRALAAIEQSPAVDPDADWYAKTDGPLMTYAEANPGRTRVPRRLALNPVPRRDAGGSEWYDGLGRPSPSSSEGGTGGDLACAADTTRYRLVKADLPRGRASDGTFRRPGARDAESPAVVASLATRVPDRRAAEEAALARSLKDWDESATTSKFCPKGFVEHAASDERWCARADRGGVSSREGPVTFLFETGKKRAEGTYVNGALQGRLVEYAPNGRKVGEGSVRDGKKTGLWTAWWENGKKQSYGAYTDGDRTGLWTYFDEQGRKASQGELRPVDNVEKKHGRWTYWHPNGTKSEEGAFEEGRKNGPWRTFDETGHQISINLWRDGEER